MAEESQVHGLYESPFSIFCCPYIYIVYSCLHLVVIIYMLADPGGRYV